MTISLVLGVIGLALSFIAIGLAIFSLRTLHGPGKPKL